MLKSCRFYRTGCCVFVSILIVLPLLLIQSAINGLHLLLLMHIAQAFVLLTANMDDVKKLASKFVSESLAEKITDFIVKATQNTGDISEENEMNAEDSHLVSEENNKYNTAKQDSESQENPKSTDEPLEKEADKNTEETQSDSSDDRKKVVINLRDEKYTVKEDEFKEQIKDKSLYANVEPKIDTVKEYPDPLPAKKISKISEEDEKYVEENKPSHNKYLDNNFVASATTTPSNYLDHKPVRNGKKRKGSQYRLLSQLKSIEDNEVKDLTDLNPPNKTLDELANNIFNQQRAMDMDLTTRKAVYEFDQYDNKNYPKSAFVATSGPVALRKMPAENFNYNKWWTKENPYEWDSHK